MPPDKPLCLFPSVFLRGSEAAEHRQRASPHWRSLRQKTGSPRPGNSEPRRSPVFSSVCLDAFRSRFRCPDCASILSDWDQGWAGLKPAPDNKPLSSVTGLLSTVMWETGCARMFVCVSIYTLSAQHKVCVYLQSSTYRCAGLAHTYTRVSL